MDNAVKFQRKLKDIPELVERLRAEKARQKDYLLPQSGVEMNLESFVADNQKQDHRAILNVGGVALQILEQAHGQIAGKNDIPMRYYRKMLSGDPKDKQLLADNVNHWLLKSPKKKRFIRAVDNMVRAFLGSRYRPVSHLDLVTSAVQVVTGQETDRQDGARSWAKGARCFAWALDPMNLDVEFVNPLISVDMENLDSGYRILEEKEFFAPDLPNHGWLRGDGGSRVFPAVRIKNSETGHGGLDVTAGLYEAICDNTAHLGVSLAQIHVGRELTEEEIWSEETHRKINEVIFAKVRDVVRSSFNPDELLKWARRFKKLETVEVDDVKRAASNVVEINGLSEGVRDDIMEAYVRMTQARGNLYDFQRAVTGAAHAYRDQDAPTATKLEDFGGIIIERGEAALTVK